MNDLSNSLNNKLGSDEIRVTPFSLDDEELLPLEIARQWLSDEERKRADAFHFENHGERFIRGRAVVRKLLSDYLDVTPDSLTFGTGERGKPFLIGEDLHFNLSHSLDRAVVAISRLPSIGIDIECFSRVVDIGGLSRRCFRDSEIKRLDNLGNDEKQRAFFWTWTAKEARMKATGEGFSLEPKKIEIEFEGEWPKACLEPLDPVAYVLPALFDDKAVACTVAATSPFRIGMAKVRSVL
tara:strand:- start:3577 stop:4293 length:717 start_codon:yes stop_codon:yes gene_type:complete